MSDLGQILDTAADGANHLAGILPGTASIVAQIAGIALRAASGFARDGKDPVQEMIRIHQPDPDLARVRESWEKAIARKFHTSEPPPPKDPNDE